MLYPILGTDEVTQILRNAFMVDGLVVFLAFLIKFPFFQSTIYISVKKKGRGKEVEVIQIFVLLNI